jgi:hypothetical protein
MENIILFADSSRGQYIPQFFAESVRREFVTGINADDWADLEIGPACEWYWDTWDRVLNNAIVTDENGNKFTLHQDGDLWLVCAELCTFKELSNIYGDGTFNQIESDWQRMLSRGRIPCMEYQISADEWLLVNIELTDNGLEFSFDSDGKNTWFSGDVKPINDCRFLLPFEFDRYGLDDYLRQVSDEITGGFLIPNDLHYVE